MKNRITYFFCFILGIFISHIFPFYIDLILVLFIGLIVKIKKRDKRYTHFLIAGYLIRTVIVFSILGYIHINPRHIPGIYKWDKMFEIFGGDAGLFEGIVRHHARSVSRGDPFSGEPLKMQDGIVYSIGPDGEDNFCSIIYDPTNGTGSPGDIIKPVGRY